MTEGPLNELAGTGALEQVHVAQPGSARGRRAVSASSIYWLLTALLIAVLAIFAAGYLRLVHYRPRLQEHVPNSAVFAAHINLQQVVYFEPVRRYLFPWFQASGFPSAPSWERVQAASEVNLTMDLREVLVAVTQSGDWVLGVAGRFDSAAFYDALAKEWVASGECQTLDHVLQCPQVTVMRNSDDGTLLAGTRLNAVREAAGLGKRGVALGLLADSPFSWGAMLTELPEEATSDASRLLVEGGVARIHGSIEPENPLHADIWLESTRELAPDSALALLRRAIAALPPAARQTAMEALRDAKTGRGLAPIQTSFSRALLMEGFERFVGWFSLAHPAKS